MNKPIATCFPYPGNKRRLLPNILPLLPEHRCYVEPFAGALAVLLAKAPAKLEVVNDIDSDLVTFYRYVKYHPQALMDELDSYLNAKKNFQDLLANPGWTDLQRATRWFLLKVCSFSGHSQHWGRSRTERRGFKNAYHGPLIEAVHERLQSVIIEQGDWRKVVEYYDAPDTLFFLDPPYVNCAETAYQPFSAETMQSVRDCLNGLQGRWILTCDDSPACRDIFAGLTLERVPIKYTTSRIKNGKVSYELIVQSPNLFTETIRKAA